MLDNVGNNGVIRPLDTEKSSNFGARGRHVLPSPASNPQGSGHGGAMGVRSHTLFEYVRQSRR